MKNLAPREKQVLLAGGVVVGVLLLIFGVFGPLGSLFGGMDRQLEARRSQVEEARQLQLEIAAVKQQLAARERKLGGRRGESLFGLIEGGSERLGIRDNLISMRPQATVERDGVRVEAVDLRLEKIRFEQLVNLLQLFERSDRLLNVRQLKVKKRFDDATLVDVNLQVEALQRGA